jgi:hypothetical protein
MGEFAMLSDSRRGDPDGPLLATVDPSFLPSFLPFLPHGPRRSGELLGEMR